MQEFTYEYEELEFNFNDDFVWDISNLDLVEDLYNYCYIKLNLYNNNYIILFNEMQNNIFLDICNGYKVSQIKSKYDYKEINFVFSIIIDSNFFSKKKKLVNDYSDSLFFYITDKCNLSCIHCYRNNKNNNQNNKKINFVLLKDFIIDFSKNGGKYITISGGEPLLCDELYDYINFIDSLNISITILSNGMFWKEKFYNRLDILRKINTVQISLDGFDIYSNSLMRNANSFDLTLENINWLVGEKINLIIAMTIHPQIILNDNNFLSLVSFINKIKNDRVSFSFSKKILPNSGLILNNNDSKKYLNRIVELDKIIYPYNNLNRISVFYSNSYAEENCGWGGLTIDYDGELYLCNRTSEIKSIGNIENHTFSYFKDIAYNSYKLLNVDNIKPCSKCNIRYICNGGCRIDHLDFNNLYNHNNCDSIKDKIYNNMIEYIKVIYEI